MTWFSAFAQAESESISQNVTMGKRRQYKEGHFAFRYKNFLGYRPGENGEPEIDPEQATIVSRIFSHFSVEIPRNKLQNLWKLTTSIANRKANMVKNYHSKYAAK